jgi:hypothetical protein
MASVDSEAELHQARSMDWRTFRVLRGDEQLIAGIETSCPASAEQGHRKTCDACRLCQGAVPGRRVWTPGREPWRPRPDVPSVAIKVHPRWQILYYPRGKKGRRIRGYTPDIPPTDNRPKKKPSEIVLIDYLAGAEVKAARKLMAKAEKSKDPVAVIEAARAEFPDYLQSYFDVAGQVLASRGKKRLPTVERNPRSPGELGRLIRRKRDELEDAKFFRRPAAEVDRLAGELASLEKEAESAVESFGAAVKRGMHETRADLERDAWRFRHGGRMNPHEFNPTKAEALLEKAVRPCMTKEEAHHAASSIERSLAAVKRNKVVPERVRSKIVKLTSQARGSKTPRGRIRALAAANRLLAQLRTYGAGSKRPSRGYKKKKPERADPRLGHLFYGPELGAEALARRAAYESQVEIAANPPVRSNPLLAIVGNPPRIRGQEKAKCGNVHCVTPRDAWVYRNVHQGGQAWFCSPACHDDHVATGELRRGSRWRKSRVHSNPLLAIVGNPRRRELDHHRHAAMDLIHRALEGEDFGALRQAHEHMQAAYRCCNNPPNPEDAGVLDEVLAEIDAAEGVLFAALEGAAGKPAGKRRKAVAGSGKRGSVKGKGRSKVRKNRASKPGKFKAPCKKRYSLEEARKKFKGFDKALKAYREFHDRDPGHVDVYELDDGESVVTVDDVHAALHRTLETNYLVPDGWDSNKNGSYWKHEHIEGAMDGKIDLQSRIEDLPLEVFDVKRNRTIKLPNGRWYITDWWREKGGRGERRRH